jgi:SpoVK/Ycf46/Vps4 family AAA+-type ATPase
MSISSSSVSSQPLGAGLKDWIRRLALIRRTATSNVIIVQTIDIVRIREIMNLNFESLFGQPYSLYVIYNIQLNELMRKEGETYENIDVLNLGMSPIQYIHNAITSQPSLAIILYIFSRNHAEALENYVFQWSQDPRIYSRNSTVLVITSDVSLFDDIVKRFAGIVEIPMSNDDERREQILSIVNYVSKSIPINLNEQELQTLVSISRGLTLHDVETTVLQSIYEKQAVLPVYFTNTKIEILKSAGLTYVEPDRGFDSIGGYNELKQYIYNNIINVIKYPDKAKELGLSIPKGIILAGLPGTGKTVFAKALSREIGLPMVQLDPSDFLRGIVGATEARTKQIISVIESLAPIVLFIDEVDQLFMARSQIFSGDSGVTIRMINTLLSYLGDQKRQSFVIGTTNFITNVDPAFLRPGRVDEVIIVPLPDKDAREQILKVHTSVIRKIPLSSDVNLQELSERTEWWTGAELEKLVLEASRIAFRNNKNSVTKEHFDQAFNEIEVNIIERQKAFQRLISEAQRLENVRKSLLKHLKGDERIKSFMKDLKM